MSHNRSSRGILAALVLAASLALPLTALADDPNSEEIVNALRPNSLNGDKQPDGTRSLRGIVVENDESQTPPSIDIHVEFEYDSAALTSAALVTLKQLGQALTDPRLADYRFRIAGFTDAAGSDQYNLNLSVARAGAVRNFLIAVYGISADKLDAMGFGETQLADPDHPLDAINRRVQITNLGS